MSLRTTTFRLLVAAALLAPALSVVRAADLDENYGYADAPQEVPVAQTKVEFGTGWYVRGDLAAVTLPKVQTQGVTFDTTNPAAIPLAPTLTFGHDTDVGYTASLGAGYSFNRWFRSDVIFDFHEPVRSAYDGNALTCPGSFNAAGQIQQEGCQPHYGGSLKTYDVLVNGYVDLGTWYNLTPYVGAGVGLGFGYYSSSVKFTQSDGTSYNISPTDPTTGTTYHEDFDKIASGNFFNLAFALTAGLSFDVYPHTKIDVNYRYLNLGRIPGSSGATLYEHEARAGLRYMIDN